MTKGRRERHKRICKNLFVRLSWMLKVKDCQHICLICKYFDMCRAEGISRKGEEVK